MTKSRFKWFRLAGTGVGVLVVLTTACNQWKSEADYGASDGEEISVASQRLAAFPGTTPWSMPVPICFRDGTNSSGTAYTDLKNLAVPALLSTWGKVPGVSFTNQGDCTASASPPAVLPIELKLGGGGVCGFGPGASCTVHGDPTAPDGFRSTLVHEVGHALGADHEHQRLDAPDNCMTNQSNACLNCKAASDSGVSCSASNWNTCTGGNPTITGPITFSKTSAQYAQIEDILWNIGPFPNHGQTPYDPLSILNYCAGPNGRDESDFQLTVFDFLGMEMLYPTNSIYPIGCSRGCFHGGAGVVTRTDGAVTTNWTERRALNVWIGAPYFGGPGNSQIPASSIAAGSSTLTFTFSVPESGAVRTTSGTVINSNSYHTAMLVASLSSTSM